MLLIRKLHKWLGLLIGLQLILWTVSGLVFAWLDHHAVSGEHSVRSAGATTISSRMEIAEPAAWITPDAHTQVYDIRLMHLLDRWVWRVESSGGVELRTAEKGAPLKLDEAFVRRLALSRYAGSGSLESVELQPGPSIEARDAGAVWRASFKDPHGVALYFSADDGHLIAARNDNWRLFDFFWMLHTMDYKGRDDFNNPLVITVATASLWLTLSGLILLFRSFSRRDFGFASRGGTLPTS